MPSLIGVWRCGDRMIDIRDRALLAFGLASAMRRSELVALQVEDLAETPDGLRVLIRRSKGDQEGQGQEIAIPRGAKLRPVEALQAWLTTAGIASGPVFGAVARSNRVSNTALSTDAVPASCAPPDRRQSATIGRRKL